MYYRYADKNNKINEMTGFGMFAENEGRVSGCYGDTKYTYDGTDAVNIHDLKDRFIEAWDNPDFRRFFAEFIYDDEKAIILENGAIVFDENLIMEG